MLPAAPRIGFPSARDGLAQLGREREFPARRLGYRVAFGVARRGSEVGGNIGEARIGIAHLPADRHMARGTQAHFQFGAVDACIARIGIKLDAARIRNRKLDALLFDPVGSRSEEHTSELQSLMRISYAVFCLEKKKNNITH